MNQTAVPARLSLPLRPLFTITILLGSFLLFLIQPLFGRLVLPVLGGSPSVWNTAMLFYQAALLGGYLYAHALSRFSVRRQMLVHLGVFAVAALTLPIGVADIGASPDGAPTFWLIGLLTVSIGPVFFAVSAQAPLMQSWFSRSGDRDAANPYFLYSASNLGSFAALLAYPLLVEPMASLGTQTLAWSAGFVALALCVALCGLATGIGEAPARSAARPATSWAKRGRWTLLAAVASGLLLSTTTHLTTDIMAMPLLWVLPLSIYLLSFVLVFSGSGPAWTRFAVHGAPLALITLGAWVCMPAGPAAATVFAAAGLLLLFIIAVALHGTLAAEKPQAEGLTDFYLWMSVGGAMGGVFCALVAPVIFNWPFEHPLLLIAAVLLVPTREPHAFWQRASLRYGAAAAALLLSWGAATRFSFVTIDRFQLIWLPYLLAVAALALLTMAAVGRRKLFAWCFAMLILSLGGWNQIFMSADGMRQRSFFGVYTVEDRKTQDYKALMHGTTMHGLQSDIPAMKTVPM
ncbi:hypothetical protein, partial [Sandarakinorhabdus sp.]|uniref:hypothetical protein n=1 Tax=Sandarakinorhabdus sp. TaxID=1916663 RepID=UPI00286E64F0